MTAPRLVVPWIALAASCGARPPKPPPVPAADRVAIIASERGPSGARLVAIDETGDRHHIVVAEASGAIVRDTNPAVSPDGRWVVFASSRERNLDQTSLWIAPIGVETTPLRLTSGDAIDTHPVWTRDGSAIVFASTRDGGDFDLFRLAIERGAARGAPVLLTSGPGHEVTPTVARDGTVIYAAITPQPDLTIESHLEQRTAAGAIERLTEGPADTSPSLSPDESTIAFSRNGVRDGRANTELWVMGRTEHTARPLVELPPTDESGPVWSHDGAFLFATSVLRGEGEKVVFSSVIHVDVAAQPPRARILGDHAGGIARLTPAVVAPVLDMAALRKDPEYLPELARLMSNAIETATQQPGTPP